MSKVSASPEILSLFCGCGGLDLGFEAAGYTTALAYDRRADAVSSWNQNRTKGTARVQDIRKLNLDVLDADYGRTFTPSGVIGGPPCQGFSLANRKGSIDDPRNELIGIFTDICLNLNSRNPLDFIVMENVPAIIGHRGGDIVPKIIEKLSGSGFRTFCTIMDAADYGVAQRRKRFILIALGKNVSPKFSWTPPAVISPRMTVREAIDNLPDPTFFSRSSKILNEFHPNHWCMAPKSSKFFDGSLVEGYKKRRSFKTLSWDEVSYTVSYGNREVHVHPNGKRRLSVFEAMRLQGFPDSFILDGSLSSQITQVSEAVPPPMANCIARSLLPLIK